MGPGRWHLAARLSSTIGVVLFVEEARTASQFFKSLPLRACANRAMSHPWVAACQSWVISSGTCPQNIQKLALSSMAGAV